MTTRSLNWRGKLSYHSTLRCAHLTNASCSELPLEFDLWCFIYTESDPRGGWWFHSNGAGGQGPVEEVLGHVLITHLGPCAERARASHGVVISCGVNLLIPRVRKMIAVTLTR
jgi:hypothetical protein